jgi:hypothetical protein
MRSPTLICGKFTTSGPTFTFFSACSPASPRTVRTRVAASIATTWALMDAVCTTVPPGTPG